MARRKVCQYCGYINSTDNETCDNCDEYIEAAKQIDVPRGETRQFYDLKRNIFSATPLIKKEEPKENPVEKPAESLPTEPVTEETQEEEMVLICPMCQRENKVGSTECSFCGAFIPPMIKPTKKIAIVKPAEQPVNLDFEMEESDFDIEEETEERKTLVLIIGKNGENIVPIKFDDSRYIIGRGHQSCLANSMGVSRHHCYLKQTPDGNVYLFESKNSPSTNGTYYRVSGSTLSRIEPGKGRLLKDGDLFYLSKAPNNVPIVFTKK